MRDVLDGARPHEPVARLVAATCGRIFESRFLPKALLVFVVEDRLAQLVVDAIVDAARSGNESGDGLVWTTPAGRVTHNRTGVAHVEA